MLQLRPNCECCDTDLPADAGDALIWFGWTLWRSRPAARSTPAVTGSLHTSLLAGLMLTLGDIKALVFYASFFPLFISAPLSPLLCLQVLDTTAAALLLVKGLYAVLGSRLSRPLNQPAARKLGGGLLVGCGLWLLDISRRPNAAALNYSDEWLA